MRTKRSKPSSLLFGSYRQRVLSLLLPRPAESFHVREIARLADVPAGSLHRELRQLEAAGLLRRSEQGNQVRYGADPGAPIFEELSSLIRRLAEEEPSRRPRGIRASPRGFRRGRGPSTGQKPMGSRLRGNDKGRGLSEYRLRLAEFCRRNRIRLLGVFGAVARGEAAPGSPVDVLAEFEQRAPSGDREASLRTELGALLGRSVQLAPPGALEDPARRGAILADLKLLYDTR